MEVRDPGFSPPWKPFDCKSDNLDENILHLTDFFNDLQDGKIAGPFRLSSKRAKVFVITKEGHVRENTFFPAKRMCAPKGKRLQSKGRRVAELTGN